MLLIQKLARPNKRSGYEILPGETKVMRGITVVNGRKDVLRIDKYTRKKYKVKSKKKK